MKLSPAIQECLCSVCLFDPDKNAGVALAIKATDLDPYFRELFAAAMQYRERYNKAAGEHALELVEEIKQRRPDEAAVYDRLYRSCRDTFNAGINRDYILAQVGLFRRYVILRRKVAKVLDRIDGSPDEAAIMEAENALAAPSDVVTTQDSGILLQDRQRSLSFLTSDELDTFPIGIAPLDVTNIRPARKRLMTLMAASGKGKSWFCSHVAKHSGILARKRTLIITLEMGEEEYVSRLMQTLFSVSTRRLPKTMQRLTKFRRDDTGSCVGIDSKVLRRRPDFKQSGIVTHLDKSLSVANTPLWVKRFPTAELTVQELESYITQLEWREGFIPDLVIVDYPDLMRFDPKYEREEIAGIYRALRGLAIRRNFALVVVTQAGRAAEDVSVVKRKHVSLAIDKVQISDIFLTYSRTNAEEEKQLARLHVAKGRHEGDGFFVMLSQAYQLGQFCVDSIRMPHTQYLSMIGDEAHTDTD